MLNQLIRLPVSFAAIHTTTMAVWHVMFDLACRPEYIQPLRHEVDNVIAEDGHDVDEDGFLKLNKTSMTKLRKLDSFLKESQRLSPPGLSMFHTQPPTLFPTALLNQNLLVISKLTIHSLKYPRDHRTPFALNRTYHPQWDSYQLRLLCNPHLAAHHHLLALLQPSIRKTTF